MLRRNILIFHAGALGDFVLTFPLALGLGRLYPQSRVIYVTHEQKGRLAERLLGVEWADVEADWYQLYTDDPRLPPRPVSLLESASTIFSFVCWAGDRWTRNVGHLAPEADLRVLQPRPDASWAGHATDYLLEQLKPLVAVHEAVRQMIRSIQQRGLCARRAGPVLIHPGSGSDAKCWPVERFGQLARRLISAGRPVRFVIGEVEMERWPVEQVRELAQIAPVSQPRTCLALHDELLRAGAFVGNDSGPGHLAGAMGVPSVILFGPTDPVVWGPLGPCVRALRADPLTSLDIDQVLAAISE